MSFSPSSSDVQRDRLQGFSVLTSSFHRFFINDDLLRLVVGLAHRVIPDAARFLQAHGPVFVECSRVFERELAGSAGVLGVFGGRQFRKFVKHYDLFLAHAHKEILLGSKPVPALEVPRLPEWRPV